MDETIRKGSLIIPQIYWKNIYKNPKINQIKFENPQIEIDPFDPQFSKYFDFQEKGFPLPYNPNFNVRMIFNEKYFRGIGRLGSRIFDGEETTCLFNYSEIFWDIILSYFNRGDLINSAQTCRYFYILVQSYLSLNFYRRMGEFPPILYAPNKFIDILAYSVNSLKDLHYLLIYAINHSMIEFIQNIFELHIHNIFHQILKNINQVLTHNQLKSLSIDECNLKIIKELVNISKNNSSKLIISAITSNNTQIVEKLLNLGSLIQPEYINVDGFNGLQIAVMRNNYEICKALLEYMSVNEQSIHIYDNSQNIFQLAAKYAGRKVITLLIRNSEIWENSHYEISITNGIIESIKLNYINKTLILLAENKNWIDINKIFANSKTILMLGAKYNNLQLTSYLISEFSNLNTNIHNNQGKTALHYAAKYGSEDLVISIIGSKESVNIINCKGKSPFFIAIERNDVPIIMLLLPHANIKTLETLDTRGIHPMTLLRWKLNDSQPSLLHDIILYYEKLAEEKCQKLIKSSVRNLAKEGEQNPLMAILYQTSSAEIIRQKLENNKFKYKYKFASLKIKGITRRGSFAIHEGVQYKEGKKNRWNWENNMFQNTSSEKPQEIPATHWIKYNQNSSFWQRAKDLTKSKTSSYELFRLFRLNTMKAKRLQVQHEKEETLKRLTEEHNSKQNTEKNEYELYINNNYCNLNLIGKHTTLDNSDSLLQNPQKSPPKSKYLISSTASFNINKKIEFNIQISEARRLKEKILADPQIEFMNTKLSSLGILRKIEHSINILNEMIVLSDRYSENFVFLYPLLKHSITKCMKYYVGLKVKPIRKNLKKRGGKGKTPRKPRGTIIHGQNIQKLVSFSDKEASKYIKEAFKKSRSNTSHLRPIEESSSTFSALANMSTEKRGNEEESTIQEKSSPTTSSFSPHRNDYSLSHFGKKEKNKGKSSIKTPNSARLVREIHFNLTSRSHSVILESKRDSDLDRSTSPDINESKKDPSEENMIKMFTRNIPEKQPYKNYINTKKYEDKIIQTVNLNTKKGKLNKSDLRVEQRQQLHSIITELSNESNKTTILEVPISTNLNNYGLGIKSYMSHGTLPPPKTKYKNMKSKFMNMYDDMNTLKNISEGNPETPEIHKMMEKMALKVTKFPLSRVNFENEIRGKKIKNKLNIILRPFSAENSENSKSIDNKLNIEVNSYQYSSHNASSLNQGSKPGSPHWPRPMDNSIEIYPNNTENINNTKNKLPLKLPLTSGAMTISRQGAAQLLRKIVTPTKPPIMPNIMKNIQKSNIQYKKSKNYSSLSRPLINSPKISMKYDIPVSRTPKINHNINITPSRNAGLNRNLLGTTSEKQIRSMGNLHMPESNIHKRKEHNIGPEKGYSRKLNELFGKRQIQKILDDDERYRNLGLLVEGFI